MGKPHGGERSGSNRSAPPCSAPLRRTNCSVNNPEVWSRETQEEDGTARTGTPLFSVTFTSFPLLCTFLGDKGSASPSPPNAYKRIHPHELDYYLVVYSRIIWQNSEIASPERFEPQITYSKILRGSPLDHRGGRCVQHRYTKVRVDFRQTRWNGNPPHTARTKSGPTVFRLSRRPWIITPQKRRHDNSAVWNWCNELSFFLREIMNAPRSSSVTTRQENAVDTALRGCAK